VAKIPVALQMYTVRDIAKDDLPGALRRVAEIGYKGVELAGTGGLSAGELKGILFDLGLEIAANHVGLEQLENNLEEVLDYNAELANDYIVCPYIPEGRRRTAADYRSLAEVLNSIGLECQDRDLQFCYHNHAFEFEKFDGLFGLDILFDATFADVVKAELDVYWIAYGGERPVEYIRRYADRVPLVHLKDLAADEKRSFAEVGEGILDMPAIVQACRDARVDWLIVEQDVCKRPPLECAAISLRNLKQMGYG